VRIDEGAAHSEAPAPAGERGRRVPGFSDLSRQLFCPRCLLVPPRLRGLPLRLCSVAYCCQLVSEPVLLARPFPFYLGLYSEEGFVRLCKLSFSSTNSGEPGNAKWCTDIQWALGSRQNVLEANSGKVYSITLLSWGIKYSTYRFLIESCSRIVRRAWGWWCFLMV
jgi:hypothetical protein